MTDLELLELAAKAIGEEFHSGHITVSGKQYEWVEWNPLTDDGDALRLAVKLGLQVYGREIGCSVDDYIFVDEADCGGDPYAATRRAIVRAAAEIGKQQGGAGHG